MCIALFTHTGHEYYSASPQRLKDELWLNAKMAIEISHKITKIHFDVNETFGLHLMFYCLCLLSRTQMHLTYKSFVINFPYGWIGKMVLVALPDRFSMRSCTDFNYSTAVCVLWKIWLFVLLRQPKECDATSALYWCWMVK